MNMESILNFSRKSEYQCEIEEDNEKYLVLRLNISNSDEATKYLHLFEIHTFTQWIRNGELANPSRVVHHKYYVCQHSIVNKKGSAHKTKYNTGCDAKLDILIKKCTPATRRNDKYLKMKPPLCGRIKIDKVHNHTIGTTDSLKYMKISDETKTAFVHSFNNGMNVTCEERTSLGKLPVGIECPSNEWFKNIVPCSVSSSVLVNKMVESENDKIDHPYLGVTASTFDEETEKRKAIVSHISSELMRLNTLADEIPCDLLEKFLKKIKKIQNVRQLYSTLNIVTKTTFRKQSKIKVQPTAISRKRPGVTRGSTRIPSGRRFGGVKKEIETEI